MASAPLEGTASAANAIARVKYSHDAMIDVIIANPAVHQNQIAAHFGYTPAWVSRIVNSDAFQARLADRKGELIDPTIMLTLEEKIRGLADMSLGIVMDKLAATRNPDTALKALELSTRALGFGAKQSNVTLQQNFVVAMPAKVVDAQEWAARGRAAGAEASVAAVAVAGPRFLEASAGEIVDAVPTSPVVE